MGACRKHELYMMKIQHLQYLGTAILVSIPDTKTKIERKFTITGEFCNTVKKYSDLRPTNATTSNFFLNYQKGRCTNQVVGINKLGNMPKQVATFLQLPNPELYTGHCFRRTSATMLVDAGADVTTLKRHGGWKSTEVAESYIDNSLNSRLNVASKIMTQFNPTETENTSTITSIHHSSENLSGALSNFTFHNCNNITINNIRKDD